MGEVRASLNAIRAKPEMTGSVSLATAPFAGQLYWLAAQTCAPLRAIPQ
jgi:hypothetical protein